MDNLTLLKTLCRMDGPAGYEDNVREFILNEIAPYCKAEIDPLGNIIAFKKGAKPAEKTVMLDAHMDEVGVIITAITDSGMLKFETVGGIKIEALICKTVRFGDVLGVIGAKPIHLSSPDERKKMPPSDSLYIDIGATDKEDAQSVVSLGDIGTFVGEWAALTDDVFRSKALDDRAGCAALINLLKQDAPYDFYATFTVGEETGLRGAKTATYTVNPDFAIVLEATTAADIYGSSDDNNICKLGEGVAVSFMDRATLYDRKLFDYTLNLAKELKISAQVKKAVTGGNNSGAIHLARGGVNTITLSIPCRYLHSSSTVASLKDFDSQCQLAAALYPKLAAGEFK